MAASMPVIDLADDDEGWAEFRVGGEGGTAVRVDFVDAQLKINDIIRGTDGESVAYYKQLGEYTSSLGFAPLSTGALWKFATRVRELYEAYEKKVDPASADSGPKSLDSTESTAITGRSAS